MPSNLVWIETCIHLLLSYAHLLNMLFIAGIRFHRKTCVSRISCYLKIEKNWVTNGKESFNPYKEQLPVKVENVNWSFSVDKVKLNNYIL